MTIPILWEDAHFLITHKPAGLPTIPGQDQTDSLLGFFPTCHAVHRLDQRVSGLVLLAKTAEDMTAATRLFQRGKVQKTYHAVTTHVPQQESPLTHWLLQKGNKSLVAKTEKADYLKSILHYQLEQSSERYHLFEITLKTGRFHQIRAQMAASGAPIVGDVKYGFKRTTPDGSIFLQASGLAFVHPFTQETVHIELPIPALWSKYGLSL